MTEHGDMSGRFVIQKHDATRLHYDFRLEAEGTLNSWVIPRGPSLDPKQRRLAVQVDDHGFEHQFEGVIGPGHGAGAVLVWDWGDFENTTTRRGRLIDVATALRRGKVSFRLHGEKLEGGFTLVRMKKSKNWLFVKKRDEHAAPDVDLLTHAPWSVKTGRLLDEVVADAEDS